MLNDMAKFRKYVKGYGFFSFAKKFGGKYGKKLMDTATKAGINAAKIASNSRSYRRFNLKWNSW